MKKKKLIKWLILLFALILVAVIFYWQNVREIFGPLSEEIWKPNAENSPEPSNQASPTPTPIDEKSKDARNELMDYVSKNISSLSPQDPVLGGRWGVDRFWFVSDGVAYVEYEDGHIQRQILVEAKQGDGGKIDYKMIGYFEPGNDEWNLKQGDDPYFGKLRDLYEWDDINKSWKKNNYF